MKRLLMLLLATSTFVNACGDDDDSSSGSGGSPARGGGTSTGSGGTSSNKGGTSGKAGGAGGMAGSSLGEGGKFAGGGAAGAIGSAAMGGASTGSAGESMGGVSASAGEGGAGGGAIRSMFEVTLENVAPVKAFTSAGVFNVPVGDSNAGPATPGKKYEFVVDAGRKQKLSFVTMLAATNDLFFGPNGDGIALYDGNGDPISGDVTSQVHLWDAGTEVNEEPKVGPNTVSKQAAPNTGVIENGNVVDIADATDGVPFNYPAVGDVIKVTLAHLSGTQFKVTILDVSSDSALQTSAGNFTAPLSPGVWVIHNAKDPLFSVGMPDRGKGLESIAEDGNPTTLGQFVTANAGITFPASPGVWVVHRAGSKPLFTQGMSDYAKGLENIAEDGNPSTLGSNLASLPGEIEGAIFNTPLGASAPGAITPGAKYRFSFEATPGDHLSFVSMLAATNDVFFGPSDAGIPLFDAQQKPLSGDITNLIALWDAGTEANEEPGIGPNTVTNQRAPNTGDPGENSVQLLSAVNDGFTYPAAGTVLKVTITAN